MKAPQALALALVLSVTAVPPRPAQADCATESILISVGGLLVSVFAVPGLALGINGSLGEHRVEGDVMIGILAAAVLVSVGGTLGASLGYTAACRGEYEATGALDLRTILPLAMTGGASDMRSAQSTNALAGFGPLTRDAVVQLGMRDPDEVVAQWADDLPYMNLQIRDFVEANMERLTRFTSLTRDERISFRVTLSHFVRDRILPNVSPLTAETLERLNARLVETVRYSSVSRPRGLEIPMGSGTATRFTVDGGGVGVRF